MRLRNVTGSEELIADSKYVCMHPVENYGRWNSFFQNENPIHIEIGMGKGQFIIEMARFYPRINFIGIERYSSVLYRAVQKMEQAHCSVQEPAGRQDDLPNLIFICMDARELGKVFGEGEVEKIYLNFSDPWPKKRHAARRLPSQVFLRLYEEILDKDGRLEFKTDNEKLFEFAKEEIAAAGWRTERITHDLHHEPEMMAGNVMTEYEEKFSALGNPIYKYVVYARAAGRWE